MASTITRDEYAALRRNGYAGPKSSLLPDTQKHWPASRWALKSGSKGTALTPVHVKG